MLTNGEWSIGSRYADAADLSDGPDAMVATAGVGNNSATWNPTLTLAAPAAAAGTYTGTVTHSVA